MHPPKVLKQRLLAFMQIFAAIPHPKQLHHHELLFQYFVELLSKPDLSVAKLAFTCLVKYKQPWIGTYRESVQRLFDDKLFRDELLKFYVNPTLNGTEKDSEMLKKEHRDEFIPLLTGIVFGRIVSKSRGNKATRDQHEAR
jgi:hypothetical protein